MGGETGAQTLPVGGEDYEFEPEPGPFAVLQMTREIPPFGQILMGTMVARQLDRREAGDFNWRRCGRVGQRVKGLGAAGQQQPDD